MRNWFNKLFRRSEVEIIENQVPLSTIYRWYLYDTALVDDVNDKAELLGLSRISSEGETKEMQDSVERLDNIETLFPFMEQIAEISSQLITTIHLEEIMEELDLDPADDAALAEKANEMKNVYKAVALSTLIGGISIGVNLGILSHFTTDTSVEYKKGEHYEH